MICVQGVWYGRYQRHEINENCTRVDKVGLCQHRVATKKRHNNYNAHNKIVSLAELGTPPVLFRHSILIGAQRRKNNAADSQLKAGRRS